MIPVDPSPSESGVESVSLIVRLDLLPFEEAVLKEANRVDKRLAFGLI